MSDYSELVEEARCQNRNHGISGWTSLARELADAVDALQQRVGELEAECDELGTIIALDGAALQQRVGELEKELAKRTQWCNATHLGPVKDESDSDPYSVGDFLRGEAAVTAWGLVYDERDEREREAEIRNRPES